jgi:signal transduction histidine kinase
VTSAIIDGNEVEQNWRAWLVERNRRGAYIAFWLTITIYPLFGLLDWLVAPAKWWWALFTTRAVVAAWSLFLFAVHKRPFFERHWTALTTGHGMVLGFGIAFMTVVMGGFRTPYYAGLNLSMMGVGLLFVWPTRVAMATFGAIVAAFVLPNAWNATLDDWIAGAPNLFFVVSTATVVTAAQGFNFRATKEQVTNQLILQRTTANLEAAHEQLKQLDQFKSQFFANITHELKTPLAMILSPLELLIQGDLGAVTDIQRSTFSSMLRSGMKLLKLINDLLDLSKLEESRIRLRIEEHDLVEYVRGLVELVQPLAQRKDVTLSFHADVPRSLAWCDLERMERVLVNLLSNATKFTPPGGHIDVLVRDQPDEVEIEVRDDGPGFPADKAEAVFERFYQVDMGGTRKHGGTGIGLALARELIELHGGRVRAESEVDQGARFFVHLPKDREHFRADAIASVKLSTGGSEHTLTDLPPDLFGGSVDVSSRSEYRLLDIAEVTERRVVERDADENSRAFTVLIVEDTPDVIRVIHLALRRHFKVMAAPDGLKGLEMAIRELPSLIITDLMMPGLDGLELTRRLRADLRTKHIPIVMLTARSDTDDRVVGLDAGVNAYLGKPFSARELLATVRGLLNIQEEQADLLMNQRMDSLETIAGGLAHEINNPLNYVKNAVKRLQLDVTEAMAMVTSAQGRAMDGLELERLSKLGTRVGKMVDTAESGLHRIGGTVELMGRYSREGYSRMPRPHDVFDATRDVVAVVLPATGREVVVDVAFQGDGLVECIPEELHQLLTNLVQNAIEASPEVGGRVDVRGTGEPDHITLSVRDNGPGIKEEDKARIFAPFFTTKGPGRGMGMGLTIARRVVQSLDGTIQVQGGPGQGTEFIISLPRRKIPAIQQAS